MGNATRTTTTNTAALEKRRARARAILGDDGPIVVVGAGFPVGKPGGHDQTFPFVPHPLYHWLTGSHRPGGVVAYVPGEGFFDFVVPASSSERLWEGEPVVPPGDDVATLQRFLDVKGAGRATSGVVALGQTTVSDTVSADVHDEMEARFDDARRPKDDVERDILQRCADATARGHARAREVITPGATERHIQIELEAEMFRAGADGTGYGTIVGTGANAAVLHFAPGATVVGEHDLVLVDAGAEIGGYTSDVTRTYAASGKFTVEQAVIYDAVLAAQEKGIDMCRPGVEWHDVHRACAKVMAEGLVDAGILKGDAESHLERESIAVFFPHGIGHMVGLGVRDVGGRARGRPAGRMSCGARPRVDMPLQAGFMMTVEPGLYFVPALIDDKGVRERFKDAVAWDVVDKFRVIGGVRIEDDIVVTDGAPLNFTAGIPKTRLR